MGLTDIPAKTSGDLGTGLTNTRSPLGNEFSAVNLEKIKDRIIEVFTAVGLADGSTAGSIEHARFYPAVRAFPSGTEDTYTAADFGRYIIYIAVAANLTFPDLSSGYPGGLAKLRVIFLGSPTTFTTGAGASLNGGSVDHGEGTDDGIYTVDFFTLNGKDWYFPSASGAGSGADAFPTPVTESTNARILTDADNGKTIYITNPGECTITVPQTLTPGFSCSAQNVDGAATTTWTVSGTQVLHGAGGLTKNTVRYASSGVIVRSATHAALMGALDS